ncbi:endonuclease SmrB [Thalassotalea mangrovi]|uniref:Ribosome rescue factor SmrB n=1 Tax=Thalassotalea mangrovi TaxID=2572245 RepID=A0A4U1B2K5_9GAMM|nr:endonuclease SmrB [Thalassotalea mangrovi]TKB43456.1 endonuclease SmrB [Thalassotalea mangrovi]
MKPKTSLNPEELELFAQAIGSVKPLSQDKVNLKQPSPAQKSKQRQRLTFEKQQFHFSDEFEPQLPSSGPMKYVRQDADSFEAKLLRRGEYTPELILDLHGLKQQESKQEIAALLASCVKQHIKCACIIHGIGNQVLKTKVPHWLVQHPSVVAFHQAPLEWGGMGALLVLIDLPDDPFSK